MLPPTPTPPPPSPTYNFKTISWTLFNSNEVGLSNLCKEMYQKAYWYFYLYCFFFFLFDTVLFVYFELIRLKEKQECILFN